MVIYNIGRFLTKLEVAHHKDEIRCNNSPDNLIVFRGKADHTAYHAGKSIVYDTVNKHYFCDCLYSSSICPCCGEIKDTSAKVCRHCYLANNSSILEYNISRAELKSLIRVQTFTDIGLFYEVTDNAVRKWCKYYNLPYRKSEIKKYTDEEWDIL